MKYLIQRSNEYMKDMTLTDVSLLKTCVMAMGVLIGMTLPQKSRKTVVVISVLAFVATYIPLMCKYIPYLFNDTEKQ